jgi:hypothetical protein
VEFGDLPNMAADSVTPPQARKLATRPQYNNRSRPPNFITQKSNPKTSHNPAQTHPLIDFPSWSIALTQFTKRISWPIPSGFIAGA